MYPTLSSLRSLAAFSTFSLLALAGAAFAAEPAAADQPFGAPKVCRFFGGAQGAVSLQFDDSMKSQVENALPLLKTRGLRATFFVNPGTDHYAANRRIWEEEVPRVGHELANHTMHHSGAKSAADAAREIGECSAALARIYGPGPRLAIFGHPGGVPWKVSAAEEQAIFARNLLLPTVDRHFFDEANVDPVSFAQHALADRTWVQIGMHGTGGEWLSTSVPTLTRLFDYLAAHRAELWIAPTLEVMKYTRERDAARPPVLSDVTARGFTLSVECDPAKLAPFDQSIAALWNQPLTVEVPVPATWTAFTVTQGDRTVRAETTTSDSRHLARIDLLPNAGPAVVAQP